METNLIGYYKIDSDIFVTVSDRKQIKMISIIKSVLDEIALFEFLTQPSIIYTILFLVFIL